MKASHLSQVTANRGSGKTDRRMSTGAVECRGGRRSAGGAAAPTTLAGYAAVFNEETVIAGMFRERIAPGAFGDSIRTDDVPAQFNHDPNFVLGRTANGTVRLSEDRRGLRYEVDLNPDDSDAVRIGAIVARGDVSASSFAFCCENDGDDEWIMDDPAKLPLRIIKRARLYDVAPVTTPAYPTTTVGARTARRLASVTGMSLDVVKLELELLDQELACLDILHPAPAKRAYAPGLLGTLEREQELDRLEFEL